MSLDVHVARAGHTFEFAGKGSTLQKLRGRLRTARVLDLLVVCKADWTARRAQVTASIEARFANTSLIVRSSAFDEDQAAQTAAGKYLSVLDVVGAAALGRAIDDVFASYGQCNPSSEVLIQPMVCNVLYCGVAMTREPTTDGPYYVLNYSDRGDTTSVTSGAAGTQTLVVHHRHSGRVSGPLKPVLALLEELRELTRTERLDVEFALDPEGLVLLQVRPMGVPENVNGRNGSAAGPSRPDSHLLSVFEALSHEEGSPLSVMADWNPAEMIGMRPRALAYALYEELITRRNWASARFRYGYRDMRDTPLMTRVCGVPYINVSRSVRSFVPASLDDELCERIVARCTAHVLERPDLHDKLEFRVVPTCWVPSLESDAHAFAHLRYALSAAEFAAYTGALRELTANLVAPQGTFYCDLRHLRAQVRRLRRVALEGRAATLQAFWSRLAYASVAAELFSGMARAGFVATALLKDVDRTRGGSELIDAVTAATPNVGRMIARDFRRMDKQRFLRRHGHVRPGTYDVTVPRYDQAPLDYFDWSRRDDMRAREPVLAGNLELPGTEALARRLRVSTVQLARFAGDAIAAREFSKYVYAGFLSEALRSLEEWGRGVGLCTSALSYLTTDDLREAYAGRVDAAQLQARADRHREQWAEDHVLAPPPVFSTVANFFSYHVADARPTFVTKEKIRLASAAVTSDSYGSADLRGRIVLIESADPGYDWIFARGVKGFVTAYGGENSHMAVRAREFGMPAAIGVGDRVFRALCDAQAVFLNCEEGLVTGLR